MAEMYVAPIPPLSSYEKVVICIWWCSIPHLKSSNTLETPGVPKGCHKPKNCSLLHFSSPLSMLFTSMFCEKYQRHSKTSNEDYPAVH